jgi:hypothetical protein
MDDRKELSLSDVEMSRNNAWRDWQKSRKQIREHYLIGPAPVDDGGGGGGGSAVPPPSPSARGSAAPPPKSVVPRTAAELAAEFILNGAVKLPSFFSPAGATAIVRELTSMEVDSREVLYHGKQTGSHITMRAYVTNLPTPSDSARRAANPLFKLMSDGSHDVPLPTRLGWWVIAQPTVGSEDAAGPPPALEWHIDGAAETKDPHASKRIVLLLPLVVRTSMQNGPSIMKRGSHRIAAEILRKHGPMAQPELVRRVVEDDRFQRLPDAYATGNAGDMWLLHPFTMHSTTRNRSSAPRPQPNQFVWTNKGSHPMDIAPAQHNLIAAACHMWLDEAAMARLIGHDEEAPWEHLSGPAAGLPQQVQSLIRGAHFISSQSVAGRKGLIEVQTIQHRLGSSASPSPLNIISNVQCLLHSAEFKRDKVGRYGWATLFHELSHLTRRGVLVFAHTDAALKQWIASIPSQLETALVPRDRMFIYDKAGTLRQLSEADCEYGRSLVASEQTTDAPTAVYEFEDYAPRGPTSSKL